MVGKNVTTETEISTDVITYSPATLPPGSHSVQIVGKTVSGTSLVTPKWNFKVIGDSAEKVESAFSYRGRWNNSYSLDQIEGEELTIGKSNFGITGEWNWLKIKADSSVLFLTLARISLRNEHMNAPQR